MKSKLEGTVIYFKFVDCTPDAAERKEELQNRSPQQQDET